MNCPHHNYNGQPVKQQLSLTLSLFPCDQIESALDVISMVIVEMRVALEHVICESSAATSGDKHEKHKLKQNMRDILGCSLRNVRL